MTLLLAAACQPAHLGDWRNLIAVIWDFLSLSLFSLGGGNTLLAELPAVRRDLCHCRRCPGPELDDCRLAWHGGGL